LLFGHGPTHLRGVRIVADVVGGDELVDSRHILTVPEFNPTAGEALFSLVRCV
jgi:hypothetical protein